MFIACDIVTALLAALLVFSAIGKFTKNPKVVEMVHTHLGYPMSFLALLGVIEVVGAIGLVVGLWVAPLGIAAAVGVILYFAGAIVSHLRVKDVKGMGPALLPLVLAIASLVLRALSA